MIEINHECKGELEAAARKALDAANEFWDVKEAAGLGAAVQWLRDDAGGLLIFTRGEYRSTLMQNIEEVRDLGQVVTFGEQLDAIELQAEVKRLQSERRQICQHLVGRDDCEDVPGVVAAVLDERMEAQRKAVEVKRLQAVMDAADAFLATPPDDMPDGRPFHQYTTAGDCRALNKAYHDAAKGK